MIYYRNGKFVEDLVDMDLSQPAFRTGYGFFETIAWNGRKACHLDLHLKRARVSLKEFSVFEESIDYEKIISEVIEANALTGRFARVNIFFPVEKSKTFPIITAVLFEHDPERIWSLMVAKDIFLTGLMRHKTMNRMDYLYAWQTAHESGFDDAVLTDFEGRVLESSVASLLFKKGDMYIEPQTYYKLPGTSQEIAAKHLKIESKPVLLESVHEFDYVFALNTLGGMIPVSAIGDVVFDTEHETSRKISDIILELN
ncbi:aminotransferase class IV [Desulfovibrio gilichinskyi]|uniref:4-amino-4-deoxychorismate lyase n=1 Tax=Desulfovibrio gilichinskyi TaxID=1519643 RepID=A0A1X7D187_9BACT|nr:aminotransferase class IV [Desulfovibrio gilichinskyi]SMF06820.1 4-amino-4-deoxychorismate lyase [Desulfovibrio gilichinskyi]